jgi:uncharacterized protein with von Willebrand factor type A (vWA) domain
MFLSFFTALREAKVPVSLREYLTLMEALDRDVIGRQVEDFYYLSRATLVKDERHLDRFDQVFGRIFKGLETPSAIDGAEAQAAWLAALGERYLTEDDRRLIEAMGGLETVPRALAERAKAEGGGSGAEDKPGLRGKTGASPFGADGHHPEGQRIGQDKSRHGKAIKVWDQREYKNLDERAELGPRNIKIALRRLRKFARQGAAEELDLDGTIHGAANKGYLDIVLRPERRNAVKVLLLFDIGGSMDGHVKLCQELFSAARAEFKTMDFFYFHNCLYERVWTDNRRRQQESLSTFDLLHKYGRDYKIIFVGDATMSPYEVTAPGGSVEHWNPEAGAVWLDRVTRTYERVVWLNPVDARHWDYSPSVGLIRQLLDERMYPLTLEGLDRAMRELAR